ncbi:MAG TPA: inositol monophosphatase family protein [Candidatus Peribacterales bacterium]|nr:inositol monophosphatase family protein [Candidatus Peribacterales bacterium]
MFDLDHALTIATEAAKKAGEKIKQGFTDPIDFHSKGDIADRVTPVDIDAQKIIQEILFEEFPNIGFLGEEGDEAKSEQVDNAQRWIVDPLDGTMNFTRRIPFCGVMIALEQNGEIVLGVLHFPAFDWTYTATKGGGAKKNGRPIRVGGCALMKDAMVAEIFSDREARGKQVMYPPVAAYRRFGSAITSLAFLAEGMIDATALRCSIWDVAAGKILIEEAGGSISIRRDDPRDPSSVLTCIASVPAIHSDFVSSVEHILTTISA